MAVKIKVIIDARKLGDGGIGAHIESLIDGLLGLSDFETGRHALTLLIPPGARLGELGTSVHSCIDRWQGKVALVDESAGKYSFSEYFLLALKHRKLLAEHDVFHSPHYTLPFFLRIPAVVTVHDLIHVNQPENFYHKPIASLLIRLATSRAAHTILVSRASRGALRRAFGFKGSRKTVIPNACRSGLHSPAEEALIAFLRSMDLDLSYLLFVGSGRPHKGFDSLIKAIGLVKKYCEASFIHMPRLAVVGGRFSDKTAELIKDLGLSEDIRFLGNVSTRDLCFLYHGARAVVVPSREEGFGLVALEAMKCGIPVICTPAKSLQEVCGEAAFFSEDFSETALAKTMMTVINGGDFVKDKVDYGRVRAGDFDRRTVGRKTLDVYEAVFAESNGHPNSTEVNLDLVSDKKRVGES